MGSCPALRPTGRCHPSWAGSLSPGGAGGSHGSGLQGGPSWVERGTAFPTEAEATPSTRFGELWASRCLLSTGDTAADRSSAPDRREEHTRQQQRNLTLDNRTETGPGTGSGGLRGGRGAVTVTPGSSERSCALPAPGATCPASEGRRQHLSQALGSLGGGRRHSHAWGRGAPGRGRSKRRARGRHARGILQKHPRQKLRPPSHGGEWPGTGVRAGQGGLWLSVAVQRGATDGLDLARFDLIHALAAERRLDSHGGWGRGGQKPVRRAPGQRRLEHKSAEVVRARRPVTAGGSPGDPRVVRCGR